MKSVSHSLSSPLIPPLSGTALCEHAPRSPFMHSDQHSELALKTSFGGMPNASYVKCIITDDILCI